MTKDDALTEGRIYPAMKIYVIFVARDTRPGRLYDWRTRLVRWAISTFTRSDLIHVSVGDGEVVVSPQMEQIQYFPFLPYISCPEVRHVVEVNSPYHVHLAGYQRRRPLSIIRGFLKWLSCGALVPERDEKRDCVCLAKDLLAQGGYRVPPHIYTPVGLYDWLMENGFAELRRQSLG